MLLTPPDAILFFKLHRTLMFFVNQRLGVLADAIATPEEFAKQPPEKRLAVRDALLGDMDLIGAFVDENYAQFADDELAVVRSWRQLLHGTFYIFRDLKKYTVFLTSEDEPIAYGVTALTQPFEDLVGPYLPVMTDTVLLPFKDKIIYDGLLAGPGVSLSFGPGIRRMLNESYQEAKDRYGIVTSLPVAELPQPKKPQKTEASRSKRQRPDEVQGILSLIVGMTDQFCRDRLNGEYAALCRRLAEMLARKRPSPLLKGKPNTWACGIVRTIGLVNFLDDRSQRPHMKLTVIAKAFGVGESTGQGKSKLIRSILKIGQFDHRWTLPSRMNNVFPIWLLNVNGLMMDIRQAPREAQEVAFEKGLIPYIPADREGRV